MSAGFSDKVLAKARALREEDVVQDEEHPEVWWVTGKGGRYRVQVGDGWASCTCPYGLRRSDARCYHVAAVVARVG